MTVLLQRLDSDRDYAALDFLRECLDHRRSGVLVTLCEGGGPLPEAGTSYGWHPDAAIAAPASLAAALDTLCRRVHTTGRPQLTRIHLDAASARVFIAPVSRPVQLLLLGGGPDAAPLAALAQRIGWEVTVLDHRAEYARGQRFPGARRVLEVTPAAPFAAFDSDEIDAAVVMSHNLAVDRDYLRALAATTIAYVGLLGPAPRRRELLEALGATREKLQPRLFGPAGLDIGGEQPESIALSVLAEAHAVLNARAGAHLRDRGAPLHAG